MWALSSMSYVSQRQATQPCGPYMSFTRGPHEIVVNVYINAVESQVLLDTSITSMILIDFSIAIRQSKWKSFVLFIHSIIRISYVKIVKLSRTQKSRRILQFWDHQVYAFTINKSYGQKSCKNGRLTETIDTHLHALDTLHSQKNNVILGTSRDFPSLSVPPSCQELFLFCVFQLLEQVTSSLHVIKSRQVITSPESFNSVPNWNLSNAVVNCSHGNEDTKDSNLKIRLWLAQALNFIDVRTVRMC